MLTHDSLVNLEKSKALTHVEFFYRLNLRYYFQNGQIELEVARRINNFYILRTTHQRKNDRLRRRRRSRSGNTLKPSKAGGSSIGIFFIFGGVGSYVSCENFGGQS